MARIQLVDLAAPSSYGDYLLDSINLMTGELYSFVGPDVSNSPTIGIGPPSGLIPYAAFGVQSYLYSNRTTSHPGASLGTWALIRHTVGSGTFGPATADFAGIVSCTKNDFLTSTVEGEIDTLEVVARQGRKGDVGALVLDVEKVRTGTGADTGGATIFEGRASTVDASEVVIQAIHFLPGFLESAGSVSNGKGYGAYAETRKGTAYAAFYGGNIESGNPAYEGPNAWENLISGSTRRDPAYVYFRVSSPNGAIYQGLPADQRVLGYDGAGAWTIKDETNAALLTLTEGELSYPGSAWTPYTPTTLQPAAGSGYTFTGTFSSKLIGKTRFWRAQIVVTTNGTGSGAIYCSLPSTPSGSSTIQHIVNGSRTFVAATTPDNKAVSAVLFGTNSIATVYLYDGTYPGVDGAIIVLGGEYEEA